MTLTRDLLGEQQLVGLLSRNGKDPQHMKFEKLPDKQAGTEMDTKASLHEVPLTPPRSSLNRLGASGLKWYLLAGEPIKGKRLDNESLVEALTRKVEFTQQEWDAFGIQELRIDNYVKAAAKFYKPVPNLQTHQAIPSNAVASGDFVFP